MTGGCWRMHFCVESSIGGSVNLTPHEYETPTPGETVTDVRHFRLYLRPHADQFTPLREAATHDLAVVHRSQSMPARDLAL
jgi:hypothetical protein